MAEVAVSSAQDSMEIPPKPEKERSECDEPAKKKLRTSPGTKGEEEDLGQRLSGILSCVVCLDLPECTVFQCTNGHLMCAGCFTHLLADARLKDEQPTCPNCRCEISKNLCSRNLAVEKACSELPAPCSFCPRKLPRHALDHHQRRECVERPTHCPYERIGCQWAGPYHELADHETVCSFPNKPGKEVLESILAMDEKGEDRMKVYQNVVKLLSVEKTTFNDLQLRPYRTDDFITKLYYETSRFSALNQQWVLKARVNDDERNPSHMVERHLTFQLILKSRITNPLDVQFMVLSGPFSSTKMKPKIYRVEFNNDNTESPHSALPLVDATECNKLLSSKTINLRLILSQVQK